ncbi:Translation elongation factor [Spironucleus salmonicida]|uniref:Eukaryotic peptide chain release factor GTP-binding subunit n=1 Tax=Spironucleus salmonicida TaxID=348837 RepID=V6LR73_9EUKA|nr:Translation elongation factor [Spironucleus salmonicida]|eukprot:EST43274.1 Eukaryotic peptide chain release factor GTP-binding subunit [Spironucleus salmonicida]
MSKFSLTATKTSAFSLKPAESVASAMAPKKIVIDLDAQTRKAEEEKKAEIQAQKQAKLEARRAIEAAKDTPVEHTAPPPPPKQNKKQETKPEREARLTAAIVAEEKQRAAYKAEKNPNKPLSVIFSGHVDHGKSSMSGHILTNLGIVDQRQIDKFKTEASKLAGESWAYAFALDACQEEREKGKTVESARATFQTSSGRRVVLLDSPGHKGFIMSMIEAAAQADIGVLVTSARKGEFEAGLEKSGQTAEHGLILYISGVRNLIVAVNKMDDPTCQYSETRYNDIVASLTKYLTSIGFKAANIQFVPVSAITGENLTKPLSAEFPDSPLNWYKSSCLVDLLDQIKIPKRDAGGFLRACVSGKYKDNGYYVVCKVEKGVMNKKEVMIQPSSLITTVQSMEDEVGDQIQEALSGENCRIQVTEEAYEQIYDGTVICDKYYPCEVVNKFVVKFMVLDHPNVLTAGFNAIVHVNTSMQPCIVSKILATLDPKTGKISEKAPKFLKNGQQGLILVETRTPICVSESSYEGFLGRVLMRYESSTIGIGQVAKLRYDEE